MRCYGIAVSKLPEIGRKDTAILQMNQSFLAHARDRDVGEPVGLGEARDAVAPEGRERVAPAEDHGRDRLTQARRRGRR